MNECKFFHYAPNYDKFYHVTCQIILQGSFDDHNYDHGFFYNINPTVNYYVTCKILPHSLITNMLNETIYGIDNGINNLKRKEYLSLNQKLDLEQDLKQILLFRFIQNHIPNREIRMNSDRNSNSSCGDNITDNQTNFDNSFSQQTRVGYFTNNVINQQQIPEGLRCNGNTTSFCGNIGNNVMATQAVSITNSQNNGFFQPINPLSTSVAQATYNVTNSQQRIGFNNNIPQHINDRENYYGNINSFHGNIINNTPVTQSYGNDIQDVNGARNFAYIRQQIDLNNNYRETENIGNNVTITQTNGLTCDHQIINDIHQVNQPQQQDNNYGNIDLHNGNIGHNVMMTQTNNGLTCDHQDIHQVNHINNNYRGTDSHNENIENNVTTTQANDLTCDHQDINDIHQVNHINNNHESHNSNIDNNVMTTQTSGLTCDRQDVNDIHQVTRC